MVQTYKSFQDTAESRAQEGQDTIHSLKQKAGETAETVAHEGAKAMRAAGETAGDAFAATKRFVQEQPLVAIGAVAVFACALGALWKLSPTRSSTGLIDRMSDYVEPHYRALRRRI